ncbi:helix-turn-helix domain-containing protein [Streptomyces sp. NPDC001493]
MARGAAKFDATILRQLRASREVNGRLLSAVELAELLGTSKARVLAYEHGSSVPEPGRVAEIAAIFKVNARELYEPLPDGYMDQLKDLRSYAGLTAAQLASMIGVSRTTYREIERLAILPARHDGTLPLQIANALALPLGMIHRALDHHPAAAERRSRIAEHLVRIFERAAVPHGPTAVAPEHEEVLQLSAHFRRPASVVCRLLNYDLGRYRALLKRYKTTEIELAYEQSTMKQEGLRALLSDLSNQIERRPHDVASSQLRFLAEAMSGQQWRTMVDLAQRNGRQYSLDDMGDPRTGYLWEGLLERKFVTFDPSPTGLNVQVTAYGLENCLSRSAYYRCLYPRMQVPPTVFRRASQLQRSRRTGGARNAWTSS